MEGQKDKLAMSWWGEDTEIVTNVRSYRRIDENSEHILVTRKEAKTTNLNPRHM